ncbi:MAG: threonine/serine exporter family protein [Lachnospiraceae bacterium]|nr:threonine/serine exporter family protein [Lachnospiraceae bacterium]
MELKEILNFTTEIGYLMICYGADVSRVEREVSQLCEAYEIREVDVFAIPSSLVITVSDGINYYTKSRRILSKTNDLDKVSKITQLCQWMKEERPNQYYIFQTLEEIKRQSTYQPWLVFLAYIMISLTSAVFYGAGWMDGFYAGMIGAVVYPVQRIVKSFQSHSVFFSNLLCSSVAAGLVAAAMKYDLISNPSPVMIGIMITMIPGLAITNGMRNFINEDFIAGIIQMLEALSAVLGIVGGIFFLIFITEMPLI